jgi:hypothetical protein
MVDDHIVSVPNRERIVLLGPDIAGTETEESQDAIVRANDDVLAANADAVAGSSLPTVRPGLLTASRSEPGPWSSRFVT